MDKKLLFLLVFLLFSGTAAPVRAQWSPATLPLPQNISETDYEAKENFCSFHSSFDWRRDWWKYLLLIGVSLLLLYLSLRLLSLLFSLMLLAGSGILSFLIAKILGPVLAPWMQDHLPQEILSKIPAETIGGIAVFLFSFLLIALFVFSIRALFAPPKKKQ